MVLYSSCFAHKKISNENKLPMLKFLVEKVGVSLNVYNEDGETPLHDAASFGLLDVLDYLLSLDIFDIDDQDYQGNTPLLYTLENVLYLGNLIRNEDEKLETVKYLVHKKHADINLGNLEGVTPLFFAVDFGHFKILKYFMENTANLITNREQQCSLFKTLVLSSETDDDKKTTNFKIFGHKTRI